MKKVSSVIIGILMGVSGLAQEVSAEVSDPYKKSNEVKLNGLYLILGAFDVTYERLLSEESSVGINVFLPFDSDVKDEIQYYLSPYYRFFFGKKYAAGFFLEGFGMLNSVDEEILNLFDSDDQTRYVTDFALGIGLGGKWVTKSGFVGEINFGIARNLFNADASGLEIISKFGISLGYRF